MISLTDLKKHHIKTDGFEHPVATLPKIAGFGDDEASIPEIFLDLKFLRLPERIFRIQFLKCRTALSLLQPKPELLIILADY